MESSLLSERKRRGCDEVEQPSFLRKPGALLVPSGTLVKTETSDKLQGEGFSPPPPEDEARHRDRREMKGGWVND